MLLRAALEAPRHAAELLARSLPEGLLGLVSLPSLELHAGGRHGADEGHAGELLFCADIAGNPGFVGFLFEPLEVGDAGLALRVLGCQQRIWQRHWERHCRARPGEPLPAVVLVVLRQGGRGCGPPAFSELLSQSAREHEALREVMPRFRCIVTDLADVTASSAPGRAASALSAFPSLVLWALGSATTPGQILLKLDQWSDALTDLANAEGGLAALEQLFVYVLNVVEARAFEPLRARVSQLAPAAAPALMSSAERLRAEGWRQGAAHGLAQGRRQSLERLMTLRFGPLSDAIAAWLEAADEELLERWLERVLIANSPRAVVEL